MRQTILALFFFFIGPFGLFSFEYKLSVCAMFKDEGLWLKEWIEYHRLVGVEHFYLYDNNSSDNFLEILQPYVTNGIVDLIAWPNEVQEGTDYWNYIHAQTAIYTHCINKTRGVSKWVAAIDIDEFLVPACGDNVLDILEKYFPFVSGLCLNWQNFGTSNIQEIKSDELMIEQLVMKAAMTHERSFIYKSIVQPLHVVECTHPHYFNFKTGRWMVDTTYRKVSSNAWLKTVNLDKLYINHYWTRDYRFLVETKIPRYKTWGSESDVLKMASEMNTVQDLSIQRFVPALKTRMGRVSKQ